MVTQAAFARLRNVSRKQVTSWKAEGYLVFDDSGGIDVAATNERLADRVRIRNPAGESRLRRRLDAGIAEFEPKPQERSGFSGDA